MDEACSRNGKDEICLQYFSQKSCWIEDYFGRRTVNVNIIIGFQEWRCKSNDAGPLVSATRFKFL